MSESDINSELLSADARGRKNVPFAVFAVIFIHIVLFVVLLIAAGCRAKARAKRNSVRPQEIVKKLETNAPPAQTSMLLTNALPPISQVAEPVLATEPVLDDAPDPIQKPTAQAVIARQSGNLIRVQTHVVQQGESIAKIAKQYGISVQALRSENNLKSNLIRVGQKLRVTLEKARRPKDTLAAL